MKKKNICVITSSLTPGGTQRSVAEAVNYLAKREDTEVSLVLTFKKERFFKIDKSVNLVEPDIERSSLPKVLYFIFLIFYLRKWVSKIKPDTIYNAGYNSFVVFALIGKSEPLYISNRSNPKQKRSVFYKIVRKLMYRRADGILAQTSLAKDVYQKDVGNGNVVIIPNTLRQLNLRNKKNDRKIILSVGRLIKSKGFDLLIEIFARANTDNWRLVILGDGPEMEELHDLSKKLNIEKKVELKGFTKDVDSYLQKSEIFAFTSLSEGYPNALLEALCTPLASISFDCDAGPRDLIDDGKNGFLVPLGDLDFYVKRLNQLIENKELREKFRQESIKLREEHSAEKTGEKLFQFLTEKLK